MPREHWAMIEKGVLALANEVCTANARVPGHIYDPDLYWGAKGITSKPLLRAPQDLGKDWVKWENRLAGTKKGPPP